MRISLGGRVSIEANGVTLDERSFPGRQGRLVFVYLLAAEGRPVPRDELADVLWGDAPPARWEKALSVLVSKLRALLEDCGVDSQAVLRSAFGCYQLVLPPGAWIDVAAAREAVNGAEAALDAGEVAAAREAAGEAAALARRTFLPGEDGLWVEEKRRELSEVLVRALECLADACLAAGDAREAVRHAEELIALESYREGGYRRLMHAHTAAGDSAEALRVYERCRRLLAEELGAYPSPETESVYRDLLLTRASGAPAARPETRASVVAVERRPAPAATSVSRIRWRRVPLAIGTALLLAAAIGTVTVLVGRGGEPAASEPAEVMPDGSGVGALDPVTGELLAAIPLGTSPSNVAVGEGAVWVLDADDRTVSRIDPETRAVQRTFSTASTPTDLAAGAGAVWIGNGGDFASFPASVSRVDPESGVVDATIPLPGSSVRGYLQGGGFTQQFVAVTDGAVWVVNPDQTVSRIDPRRNEVVAKVDVRTSSIAAGDGGVWVVDEEGVAEIDPETNAIAWRTDVKSEGLTSLAIGAGAVWAADPIGGSVWRIDPRPDDLQRTIPVGLGVNSVAFGEGAVWATNEVAGLVHRIDPGTNRARLVSRITAPGGVAVGETGVWVTLAGRPSADAALPASACRDVYYRGAGSPRFLIASDLPLQGGARAWTLPVVDAIRFVLERRGFRAGPYSVGYQSCDDSTAQADGFDVYRCFSNARAYARTPDVLGVIGAFNFGCSMVEIPIANQAPGGPLAMISPSNTPKFLTRPVRGRGQLELYPSGERNFVRIAAADHLAAPALVEAARELGADRVAVVWDRDDPDMAAYAADMRERARAIGLKLADSAAWDRFARRFDALARRLAAARPDAVLLAGAGPPHVDSMLRDLRARLGRRVALIASDGFWGVSGPDAQGMYIGSYGIPNAELPAAGKQFLEDLEANGGDPGPDFTAAYGAQAAEILLDAIARSDGTRASVTRELFETQVEGGILGDIRFDRYGDLVKGPVTIFRLTRKGPVVDRVVTVTAPPVE